MLIKTNILEIETLTLAVKTQAAPISLSKGREIKESYTTFIIYRPEDEVTAPILLHLHVFNPAVQSSIAVSIDSRLRLLTKTGKMCSTNPNKYRTTTGWTTCAGFSLPDKDGSQYKIFVAQITEALGWVNRYTSLKGLPKPRQKAPRFSHGDEWRVFISNS
jgi:hypothetical protein